MLKFAYLKNNKFSESNPLVNSSGEFFFRELLLRGVGFKFALLNGFLYLRLGFSHYIRVKIPPKLTLKARKDRLIIFGSDLVLVSNFASLIRGLRKPDSYKFKGVSYSSEPVVVKTGKQR